MSISAEVKEAYFAPRNLSYRHNEILPTRSSLVLLHGHGASASEWLGYELDLGRCHNIIAVDLRGHGRSSRPRRYSQHDPREAAIDVAQLLSALDVSHCALIAHSLGALVALELHAIMGARVRGLILVSPVYGALPYADVLPPLLAVMTPVIRCLGGGDRGQRVDYSLFKASTERDWRRAWAELRACGARSYLFWMRQVYEYRHGVRWRGVTVPTLIFSGAMDGVTRHAAAAALARDLVSSELVAFEREDHMLLLNQPTAIAAAMKTFLARIAAA